ncbi:hypothetical protein [Actinomycetospora sp. TBRC 11914]|uniref:hypothetical protein n=1 Tax=Actinomycetospora sp. TBRC 11914 TaxID=2729387 RepID=UPI00145DACD4|nr:hypothetical protein [Actinomycetospora sp. TBRC 11914]NMO90148.1 hypothetical protein [Actinomycetospora sp. TBRC 11914]
MTTGLLDLRVEDYGSRPRVEAPTPTRETPTVSVRALVLLTLAMAAFMTVAVILSKAAGAC